MVVEKENSQKKFGSISRFLLSQVWGQEKSDPEVFPEFATDGDWWWEGSGELLSLWIVW